MAGCRFTRGRLAHCSRGHVSWRVRSSVWTGLSTERCMRGMVPGGRFVRGSERWRRWRTPAPRRSPPPARLGPPWRCGPPPPGQSSTRSSPLKRRSRSGGPDGQVIAFFRVGDQVEQLRRRAHVLHVLVAAVTQHEGCRAGARMQQRPWRASWAVPRQRNGLHRVGLPGAVRCQLGAQAGPSQGGDGHG